MRILQVVPSYYPAVRYGGTIVSIHSLSRALAARGHDVEVFTTNADGPGVHDQPTGVPVLIDGVRVLYFPLSVLRRLYWAPALAQALRQDLSRHDIVHLHSVFLWPTWAGARASRRAHVPYVLSPRGMLIKEMIQRRNWLAKTAWIELIERRNVEQAAAIHVTSDLEKTELERFGWRLPPVAMIPNGVDAPATYPDSVEISADVRALSATPGPHILSFGRISWKKGLDRLLHAFAYIEGGTLAIVGTDDENLVPKLSTLARDLKIADRVRFLPRTVSNADKEHIFAAAQVFVLSSYSENFGNTVLEAMRRGLPVVTTLEVGAANIVSTAGGGLVTSGDAEQLAEAIRPLVNNPVRARAIGEAGREHAARFYGWPGIAEQMESLYKSLMK